MNVTQLNALILKKDSNNRLYRGMKCFKEGLVLDIKSIADKEYGSLDIYGKVMSENDLNVYNTNLSFDLKKNELIYTECNCVDFENNCDFNSTYICKHIGATFYKFEAAVEEKSNAKKEKINNLDSENEDYSDKLLSVINKINNCNKERASIQVNLTKKDITKYKYFYELDLKIGTKKYYVVKNIAELINARRYNKTLSYGKEFKYDPSIHYFSEEDENILNFIEEYVSLNEPFEKEYSINRITNSIFGNNKSLFIPQSALRRLLSSVGDKFITFTEAVTTLELQVLKEELPVKFNINEENGEIKISSNEDVPKPLNYKGDVYLYENNIYLPSENQIKYYKTINDIFIKAPVIVFKDNKKKEVFNKVLPLFETISDEINIDDSLKKSIVKEKPRFEVYLDRDRKKTWALVKIYYGDVNFNMIKGEKDNEYVIRDLNEEEEIEKLKEKGAHIVTLGKRILRTETAGFVATALIQYELSDLGGND